MEINGLNFLSSESIDLGDGKKKAIVHGQPIMYKDDNGEWQVISTEIVENTEAFPYLYKYVVNKNSFKIGFKESCTEDKFVSITYDRGLKGEVCYTLTGLFLYDTSNGQRVLLCSPTSNPPIVDGSTITYPEVFPGCDITFNVAPTKLKELIFLTEDFMLNITDPTSIEFNPETSYVVFGMKIESLDNLHRNISEGTTSIESMDGLHYIIIEKTTARTLVSQNDSINKIISDRINTFQELRPDGELLYGLDYKSSQLTPYPIEIDPTASINEFSLSITSDNEYQKSLSNNPADDAYAGLFHNVGSDSTGSWDFIQDFKVLMKFDVSAYSKSTIYADETTKAQLMLYLITAPTGQQITADYINNYTVPTVEGGSLVPVKNTTVNLNLGILPVDAINTFKSFPNSIKNAIAHAKVQAVKYACFDVYGINYNADPQNMVLSKALHLPKIQFLYYNSITQNPLFSSNGKLTVSWVNGGGLVAGDKHKIYYRQGSGFTVDEVISANNFVYSSGYDATSVDITGLTIGQVYSTVVVDVQVVGGVNCEGARSNVQTLAVSNSGPIKSPPFGSICGIPGNGGKLGGGIA